MAGTWSCRRRRGTVLPETTGVVLAGGRSTRFGRDKLLEPYRGVPMVHHAILRLAEVCREVVLVIPPDADEPPPPAGVAVRVARDPSEGQGPLVGVATGLSAATSPLALVAAGDMPELQTRVLLEMLRVADDSAVGAVALAEAGRARPLPCVLRVEPAVAAATRLLGSGRRRLRDLLEALDATAIDETAWRAIDPAGRTLFDVDEPADLTE